MCLKPKNVKRPLNNKGLGMVKKYIYFFGLLCCLSMVPSGVFAESSEKVLTAALKLLDLLRVLHVTNTPGARDTPFSIKVEQGHFVLAGQVSLRVLLGPCFSNKEWKSFYIFFKEKFTQEHPNCSVEIHDYKCAHKSDLAKSICSLKSKSCLDQKYSEAVFDFKCLLPLDGTDLFSKKERIYP